MGPDVFNRVFAGLNAFRKFLPRTIIAFLVINMEVVEGIVGCVFLYINGDAVAFAHHVVAEGNLYPVAHVFYIDVVVAGLWDNRRSITERCYQFNILRNG